MKDNTKDFADRGRAQVPEESKAPPKVGSIMMDGDGDKVRLARTYSVGSLVRIGGVQEDREAVFY